jgi:hypothetical protein
MQQPPARVRSKRGDWPRPRSWPPRDLRSRGTVKAGYQASLLVMIWLVVARYTNVVIQMSQKPSSARLVSELELAPKHKNTLHGDYNRKLATNTSHVYLK